MFARLDYVKDFIDELNRYFDKALYKRLRGIHNMTPKEISESEDWRHCRKWWLTDSGEEVFDDPYFIDDFIANYYSDDIGCDIKHGAQQIAFIFDDIVYKICSLDVGNFINNAISDLPEEFYKLFAWYDEVEFYHNCYIYTQEFVDTLMSDEYSGQGYKHTDMIDSISLGVAIKKQYGEEYCNRFSEALQLLNLEDVGTLDARTSNWGYDRNDRIKIFDPFFYYG